MYKMFLNKVYNRGTKDTVLLKYAGRMCILSFVKDANGLEYMSLKFEDGVVLKNFEKIIDVSEDDGGVWVVTNSKEWCFDNVYEDNKNTNNPISVDDLPIKKVIEKVSVCTRCGKRAKHSSSSDVKVLLNGEDLGGSFMLCNCDNCNTRYIVDLDNM